MKTVKYIAPRSSDIKLMILDLQEVKDIRSKKQAKEKIAMKLTGDLKDKVEKAENQEEANKIIKEAGIEIKDEEMNQVAGGVFQASDGNWYWAQEFGY